MKWTIHVLLVSLVGCGSDAGRRVTIYPAPAIISGVSSHLQVPASCPVYVPTSDEVDVPEAPLSAHMTIMCAVDDAGNTYGLVDNDATGVPLAVVPGNREVGFYVGFDETAEFTPAEAVLDGPPRVAEPGDPNLIAFAAPTNILSPTDCCATSHPEGRLSPQTVAIGEQGWLISLGQFDGNPTQVGIGLNTSAVPSFWANFYVNGAPPLN